MPQTFLCWLGCQDARPGEQPSQELPELGWRLFATSSLVFGAAAAICLAEPLWTAAEMLLQGCSSVSSRKRISANLPLAPKSVHVSFSDDAEEHRRGIIPGELAHP